MEQVAHLVQALVWIHAVMLQVVQLCVYGKSSRILVYGGTAHITAILVASSINQLWRLVTVSFLNLCCRGPGEMHAALQSTCTVCT